jgi:hypothetical protein
MSIFREFGHSLNVTKVTYRWNRTTNTHPAPKCPDCLATVFGGLATWGR